MFSESTIAADTVNAYLETDYPVEGTEPFVLRVGQHSRDLAELHGVHGVDCSAYVTACNPFSRVVADSDNAKRVAALRLELDRRGLACVEGVGRHPSNEWPGEPSLLILGLTLEDAKALGAHLEQNAIVWSGADAVPQLILLR